MAARAWGGAGRGLTMIFCRTKRTAQKVADDLAERGFAAAAVHGDLGQGAREQALRAFRSGKIDVLVATDVAARGIDVPTISHVINFGLPMKAEDYVHRIGRTGRAGRSGIAVTLAERGDISMIKCIQQFTTQTIPVQQIAGLEPKTQEPRIFPPRPAGSFDDRGPRGHFGGGRPGFGNKSFRREDGGRPHHGGGKPFGQDRGFAPRQDGFAPRGDERGFAPREDRGFQPRDDRGFQPRADRGFQPRNEDRGFAPRGGDDRGFQPRGDRPFNAGGGKPAFGGKPSFGGGGDRPSFGGERRGPGGPRKGGFGR